MYSLKPNLPHYQDGIHYYFIQPVLIDLLSGPGPGLGLSTTWLQVLNSQKMLPVAYFPGRPPAGHSTNPRAFSFIRIHSRPLPKQTRKIIICLL
jgi:hypothetical protein